MVVNNGGLVIRRERGEKAVEVFSVGIGNIGGGSGVTVAWTVVSKAWTLGSGGCEKEKVNVHDYNGAQQCWRSTQRHCDPQFCGIGYQKKGFIYIYISVSNAKEKVELARCLDYQFLKFIIIFG